MDSVMGGELKKGKAYCLRLLSLRARTERELDTRLKGKGYTDADRKHLLDLLKGEGLVDDLKFTEQWIDSRLRENPKGKRALKEELRSKGVQDKIIEQAFSDKASQLDERALAADLVKRKISKDKRTDQKKLKARLFQYLLRRGFDAETAEEAIDDEVK
jgi:regulatory protein